MVFANMAPALANAGLDMSKQAKGHLAATLKRHAKREAERAAKPSRNKYPKVPAGGAVSRDKPRDADLLYAPTGPEREAPGWKSQPDLPAPAIIQQRPSGRLVVSPPTPAAADQKAPEDEFVGTSS
jgi:hypothetical protein